MNVKIKIEYSFESIEELLKFLKKAGKEPSNIEVEKKDTGIRDILKEMNPDSIDNADDDTGE